MEKFRIIGIKQVKKLIKECGINLNKEESFSVSIALKGGSLKYYKVDSYAFLSWMEDAFPHYFNQLQKLR